MTPRLLVYVAVCAAVVVFLIGVGVGLAVAGPGHEVSSRPFLVVRPAATVVPWEVRSERDTRIPRLGDSRAHLPRRPIAVRWRLLAQCESSGRWDANTGNGYYGGLQFLGSTWTSFDTQRFASRADLATPRQQVTVAERVLRRQGWGAWPSCSRQLGWR